MWEKAGDPKRTGLLRQWEKLQEAEDGKLQEAVGDESGRICWDQFRSIDVHLSTYYGFWRPHVKSQRYRDAKPWPND